MFKNLDLKNYLEIKNLKLKNILVFKISKYTIIIIFLIAITIILACFVFINSKDGWFCEKGQWMARGIPTDLPPSDFCTMSGKVVETFEECRDLGFAIQASLPPACETPGGKKYVQGVK